MDRTAKRMEADKILVNKNLSADEQVFLIQQLFKDELENNFPQLNYALLAWKDAHLRELYSKEVVDSLERLGIE